ncbi:MAG: ABC transporter permease [Pisciglobus halotolerans]|nr:ABC transporter permease [Atopostipes sp.]MDN6626930.1 ABC transporter permease [Pisciglobus halotolerans]
MAEFLANYGDTLISAFGEHILLSVISLALGILFAVPVGIFLSQTDRVASIVMGIAGVLQTIPTLALLALMVPLFGVGKVPAVIALFIYSLLPILRNTYLGMKGVDPMVVDAAKAMGMKQMEVIQKIQLPLAVPVIMAGIRLSAVYVIAWTSIAAYIGGGGLGEVIFNGLELFRSDLILAGTIPVIILAILTDLLAGKIEKKLTPRTSSTEIEEK